jgi:hypothetical protein
MLPFQFGYHLNILAVVAEVFPKDIDAPHIFTVVFYADFKGNIFPFRYMQGR